MLCAHRQPDSFILRVLCVLARPAHVEAFRIAHADTARALRRRRIIWRACSASLSISVIAASSLAILGMVAPTGSMFRFVFFQRKNVFGWMPAFTQAVEIEIPDNLARFSKLAMISCWSMTCALTAFMMPSNTFYAVTDAQALLLSN